MLFRINQQSLSKGEKVQLIGFGNFEVRERARKGRNPQTGKEMKFLQVKFQHLKLVKH